MSSKKSTERLRAQLLAVAAQLLGELHLRQDSFTVSIASRTGLEIRLRRKKGEDELMQASESRTSDEYWLPFSPCEARLIEGLKDGEWIVTAQLAIRTGDEDNGDLKAILRNLQERKVVEICTRRGVRLNRQPLEPEREPERVENLGTRTSQRGA